LYTNFEFLIILLFSYICGSIPFGLILSIKLKKGDPRNIGSKNIGATNVLRLGGWRLGLITLLMDILKAYIPLKIVLQINENLVGLAMISITLGHLFPIWLKFKGGKGISTLIGILLAYNTIFCFIYLITWLISALIFRYSSLSAILATFINLIIFFTFDPNFLYLLLISLLIIFMHFSNIKRLVSGNEDKIF
jgi:glycerol-3-phosphate acyltransferase PlsY